MISRRWAGCIPSHAPISAPVRPHPAQKPVAASITQMFTHGVSMLTRRPPAGVSRP